MSQDDLFPDDEPDLPFAPEGEPVRFDGPEYTPEFDKERLTGQCKRIFDLMADQDWRTLAEIETATGDPAASISAQLRHLRKERFGAHTVNRRARGEREHGLFEYQVIQNIPEDKPE
jgi:hypothetical protein